MTAPSGIYPFATQEGVAIPLDIIKPSSFLKKSFVAGVNSVVNLVGTDMVATFMATADALVQFGAAPSASILDNTQYSNTLFLPANILVTVAVPSGAINVQGIAVNGTLYIQAIEKWAGLGIQAQYSRR